MNADFTFLQLGAMALSAAAGIAIPVLLFILIRRKTGADVLPFFTGCAVMLVFALVLEQGFHALVLSGGVEKRITGDTVLYGLYGGLAAGVFEETGRLAAFLTVLKRYRGKDANALMYGAGHGGFEALAVLSLTMAGNLSLAVMAKTGALNALPADVPAEAMTQLEDAVRLLSGTPAHTYLWGIAERLSAVILHVSLSVMVWFAVKRRRWALYPAAVLLHAAVDFAAVWLSRNGTATYITELAIFAASLLCAAAARLLWRRYSAPDKEDEILSRRDRKKIAPIVIGALAALYYAGFIAALFLMPGMALWLRLVLGIVPAALVGVAVFVVKERLDEIDSGEEDDLDKY